VWGVNLKHVHVATIHCQELVKLLKAEPQAPTPFLVALLLAIARIPSAEASVLDVMKSMALQVRRNSAFAIFQCLVVESTSYNELVVVVLWLLLLLVQRLCR